MVSTLPAAVPAAAPSAAEAFIAKWARNARPESAAAKEHFADLCDLLGAGRPNDDAEGAAYAFEKGLTKAGGGKGFADVWKRGCFAWEYKSRGGDLDAAHVQLLRYAAALEHPPLLVVSDMDRIVVHTAWTNAPAERHAFALADLRDPAIRARLAGLWAAPPEAWRPRLTRQAITEAAAADFAELAQRLRQRGHDAGAVARFVNRLVFCFFAEDVGLLPRAVLADLLALARARPDDWRPMAGTLFAALAARGGRIGFTPVPWFNSGLFADAEALPLRADDLPLLDRAAARDWAAIDPAIMGTLFERGLDPAKRGQLGAHYTDRATIERIVGPVIRAPLLAEWEATRTRIAAALAEREALRAGPAGDAAERLRARSGAMTDAASRRAEAAERKAADARRRRLAELLAQAAGLFAAFRGRLRAYRFLDPACGSGNFLYVGLLALKDVEGRALAEAAALGLSPGFPEVGPEAALGLEVNPFAAELARVSVWIGHIQWARANGYPPPEDPVLRTLDTIACRDAVLAEDPDGRPVPAPWPEADAIVGNPPFLGDKKMIGGLGEAYVARLRAAHAGRVPGGADLVAYWFDHARAAVAAGRARAAGLVGTNSLRGGANRQVLDAIAREAPIFEAWADEPWVLDGAAVRVSLVCFGRDHPGPPRLDGAAVATIHADLTAGALDLTTARQLPRNAGTAFIGTQKSGPFDVDADTARRWLREPTNPNGRPNSDVVRPWRNGLHVLRRADDAWVIDFGASMGEAEAAYFAAPFAHVVKMVKPGRVDKRESVAGRYWWRMTRPRPEMRHALAPLARYIVTPRVAKHRVFAWLPSTITPDCQLVVIARDDDATFGVLHSRFHEVWALRLGTWLGVGNDPRYTPSTTFETFPFPDGLTPDRPAPDPAAHPRAAAVAAAARALVAARDRWLNPPELVVATPEVVPGFPDRLLPRDAAAAAVLKRRTLTALYNARGTPEGAWLDALHAALDAAVAAAYGWPADLPPDEALARLLALNLARAAGD